MKEAHSFVLASCEATMIILDEIDSTNNYVKRLLAHQPLEDELTVLARYQTAGRGQQSKVWHGNKGDNLLMTLAIKPTCWGYHSLQDAFILSCAVANAILGFLAFSKVPEDTLFVKWPNDIYVHHHKIAGILLETVSKSTTWEGALIGIGMNINQLNFSSVQGKSITSLRQITHTTYNIPLLARQLKKWLLKRIACKEGILEDYTTKLIVKKGEWTRARIEGVLQHVQIVDLHLDGRIDLRTQEGTLLTRLNHRQITWDELY